jgi:phosphomannomutase
VSAAAHRFHPTILREYDVRGIVGETLFAADARALGRALGTMLAAEGGRRVVVGYDGRLSSPELEQAAVDGLVAAGMEVSRIGRGPTPMVYFATHLLKADGGLQVTGSHNPPDHNGFKMTLGTRPLYGERIVELGRIAATAAFADGEGSAAQVPVMDAYVERLAQALPPGPGLQVVWDAGNGAAGTAMAALTARLPGRHTLLFEEIDGRFPNHHPDPTVPENLEALIARVRADGADLGIAFDGDGDRIGVVDGQGRMLYGDQLLLLLAQDLLPRYPGATVIADVKTSRVFYDEIARQGGRPLMWKTGHSLIKAKMAEVGAPISGEMSGHIFYADGFYGHDDALYVAVRLLEMLTRTGASLARLRDDLPQTVSTPETRFDCPDERKFEVVAEVAARLAAEGAKVVTLDGVRVETPDGWWLLRASNTQAVLVARAEAADEAGLARLKAAIRHHLVTSGVTPPDF